MSVCRQHQRRWLLRELQHRQPTLPRPPETAGALRQLGPSCSSNDAGDGPGTEAAEAWQDRGLTPLPPNWQGMGLTEKQRWCTDRGVQYRERGTAAGSSVTGMFSVDITIPPEIYGALPEQALNIGAHSRGRPPIPKSRQIRRSFPSFMQAQWFATNICLDGAQRGIDPLPLSPKAI